MKIGVDIDGVLTNIEQYELDVGSKFFYKESKKIVNRAGYDIKDIFNVSKEEDNRFWNRYLFYYAKNEPTRKFAAEIINKLREYGAEIYIITARSYTIEDSKEGKKMRKIVRKWLKKNHILYDKLIFSPDNKKEICIKNKINVMIEDNPKTIVPLSEIMPVIAFDAEYNRMCFNQNIYRVYTWYEVYETIKQLKLKKL